METISRPYRFLLRLYYVVQSSYCVHLIFGGRSRNVAGVMGVLGVTQLFEMASTDRSLRRPIGLSL